ncbi:MAG: SurA N-terminal domain-containing protein [Woeseiaceae bacterium]|nr:SurA N-terminal domain-containing protein [Woeseiaceae bacterium]
MLQNIRDRFTGGFAIAILALLCVPFVFFGINYDFTGSNSVAEVNGEEIPMVAFDNAYRQQLANYSEMGELPDQLRALLKESVLNNLVWDAAVQQYLAEANYRISDEMITRAIHNAPQFQVDGQFSRDNYYAWLAERGLQAPVFEANQRFGLRENQLQRGIGATAFVTPAEYRRYLNLYREQREVSIATFDIDAIAETVEVSDEDVQTYYDERPEQFLSPESVDFRYLELRRDELRAQVDLTEEEIQAYYEEASGRFLQDEQRRARHILIPFGDDEAAAREQATAIAERARAGEPFADLARDYSADSGTADEGGDLGMMLHSQMDDALGDAVFSMRQGEIAGPVRSDFGFHVVKLEEVREGGPLPLAQVRAELERELRAEKAADLWADAERALSDALFDADNIEGMAAETGLPVKQATGFTRSGGEPFGSNQAAIDTIFSDAVLEERRISDIIELDANRSVAVQVTDYNEASRLPPVGGARADRQRGTRRPGARYRRRAQRRTAGRPA